MSQTIKKTKNQINKFAIGVDVGTGSVRAGMFTLEGKLVATCKFDITTYFCDDKVVEQSSDDIWRAVCSAVKGVMEKTSVERTEICGLGFDATCSLVALDKSMQPVTVSPTGLNERNVIVWMDHRAEDQAAKINHMGHKVLEYVGGKISPEMQTPKLLWLKENLPDSYHHSQHFMDLTDFLTFKASGSLSRSVCTVTCKWTYMAHEETWDESYFRKVGLEELIVKNFERIGNRVVEPGTPLANGLTKEASKNLGLMLGTPVGAGLIDAHAGGVGTVGAVEEEKKIPNTMAYVFGTSACTMTSSTEKSFVPGVWGPYYSAMVPGLWLSEGGQSAAGEAIAKLIQFHPGYEKTKEAAEAEGLGILDYILNLLSLRGLTSSLAIELVKQIVVVPDFLGNRAPFADPHARAVLSGLDLGSGIESILGLYLGGIFGLGYGLRQIINKQSEYGVDTDLVVISGGAASNPMVKQLLADSSGVRIAEPSTNEPVLLGSAMLGAVAGGAYKDVQTAMSSMSGLERVYEPASGQIALRHKQRFKAYEELQAASKIARHF